VIRILIVDDHALVRTSLRARLAGEHDLATVGEAGSVAQAVARARSLQPDLVLLDLVLPDGNGWEAISQLARVAPDARVLMMSGSTAASSVRQALSAGAVGYVSKRVSDDELLRAIRKVAGGDEYVEPALGASLVLGDRDAALEPLSERERDVLSLLALGYTNQEIGKRLFISVRTVDTHRAHIMRKLELESRAELVMFSLAHGLIGAS
jgi:DNA-binding NarL/FixJ family response regulator